MRAVLRITAFLLAILLLVPGLFGLMADGLSDEEFETVRQRGHELFDAYINPEESQATEGEVEALRAHLDRGFTSARVLGRAEVWGAVFGIALFLFLFAVWPRKPWEPPAEFAEKQSANSGTLITSKKERKRSLKQAEVLAKEGRVDDAGELLLAKGLRDEAADLFVAHEFFHRAAEVRHDQNRFEEAAELYLNAERPESAGAIYARLENFEAAAACYLKAQKNSIAGEMYERANKHADAGRCYKAIGFTRHAAKAFLKAGRKAEAAQSLIEAFDEEGGGAATTDEKARELRSLAKKAGGLLADLERFDEAEAIYVRGGAFSAAAKVAYQTGSYERAAELFFRCNRGDLAAKALEKMGDEVGSARALGEHLRDAGEIEKAVEHLEKAGEFQEAGDLFRRLEQFEKSGECYLRIGDYPAAAEMFRAGQLIERAAEAFESCGEFDAAAECYLQCENLDKYATALEQAGRAFEAGKAYAERGLTDEAIRLLQMVESDCSEFKEACFMLGELFGGKGMESLSIRKYEQSVGDGEVTRANVSAHFQLAVAYEKREEFDRAVEAFERVLSFDYHHADVAQRIEAVKAKRNAQQAPSNSVDTVPSNTTVGSSGQRYELIRELGRGGMGVVYLARDSVLEREVAFKVLPEGLRQNPNALKNFLREAKAAAQLNHPNIVTVYDAGDSEHGFYLAMEYVNGTTLKEIVQRRGAIAPGGVIYILRQMTEALGYAHSRRVVHRDVKTANTMWTQDKQVKIMDFGLAKLMEEVRNATTLVSGTPFYMSPEQTLGRNVDHRTDLYSLGVTLFELSTGELPFQRGNVPYHHVHTAPPSPREANPELPGAIERIILRLLEKDPEARFQTAQDILDEIDRLSGRTPAS